MLRSIFVWLSRNKLVRGWMTSLSVARRATPRLVIQPRTSLFRDSHTNIDLSMEFSPSQ